MEQIKICIADSNINFRYSVIETIRKNIEVFVLKKEEYSLTNIPFSMIISPFNMVPDIREDVNLPVSICPS